MADELYQNYLNILKNNIKKNYKNTESNHFTNEKNMISIEEISYTVEVDENLNLNLSIYKSSIRDNINYNISSEVLNFFIVETGNGGMNSLYFIKKDGSLFQAVIEGIKSKEDIEITKLEYKNIVSVISGTAYDGYSGGAIPIFIDIEGNMYF